MRVLLLGLIAWAGCTEPRSTACKEVCKREAECIDATGSKLKLVDYTVGDSFGVFALNDPALVEAILKALDAPPDFPIGGRTLREVLTDGKPVRALWG